LKLPSLPFVKSNKPQEDERLLQLFRNRAGLKKAHASLQDEVYDLKERVKQQEKTTAKVQDVLDGVETLLGNPEAGYSALVFYQLRGLWRTCNAQLMTFASELERQQEDRERRRQMSEFNQQLAARIADMDRRLTEAEEIATERQRVYDEVEQRLRQLNRIWHYFKRRKLQPEVTRARVPLDEARQEVVRMREEREPPTQEQCPPFPGLAIDGRRAINLATIAYALVIGARLSGRGLAPRTKDAMTRRVQETQYGGRAECEALMEAIAQAQLVVKSRKEMAAEIKACVELLREVAQYRSDGDTIPLTESLAGVVPSTTSGQGVLALSGPQVLADDYWHVYQVLLR
jgi:DNA repair exonuclease SbcCD ATPase subunit